MKEEKDIRKLSTLLHKIFISLSLWDKDSTCIGLIRKRADECKDYPKYLLSGKYQYQSYIDAINIIDKYNITEEKVKELYYKENDKRLSFSKIKNFEKPIITRDNKSDLNKGSWGSNCNKIRYPSKKRPLSTWKRFYKLFPYQAELDKFDGKTSEKMK